MDELAARRAEKQRQQMEYCVGELCASLPEWFVKRMDRKMQDDAFKLAIDEAKDRLKSNQQEQPK